MTDRSVLEKIYLDKSDSNKVVTSAERAAQKKYAFNSKNDKYVPHVYLVFNDQSFRQDVKKLRQEIESLYYKDISLFVQPSDEHLLKEDILKIKALADKYCIAVDDLSYFADGAYDQGYKDFGKPKTIFGGIHMWHEDHEGFPICYVIGPKTTLEDISRDWAYIKDLRHSLLPGKDGSKIQNRVKAPENPELIYAVFKARCSGLKFKDIYMLYVEGKLPGYKGSIKQFMGDESLERYYRKYMPEVQAFRMNHSFIKEADTLPRYVEDMKNEKKYKHLFEPDT